MIPLSQKDPRWGDLKINNTNYSMSGWGCFVTAVSIVAEIDPTEALNKLQFDGALLIWDSIKNIGLEPLYKGDWDNAKALEYIQANGQCIARVDFDGSERTDDTHFVVLIGNKRLYDPWDGREKATSTYSKYTGIRACRKMTMADDKALQTCLADREKFWKERDALLSLIPATDVENAKAVLGGIRGRITELEGKLGTAQAEVKNREEQVSRLKEQLLTEQKSIEELTNSLKVKIGEYEDLAIAKGKQYIELQQALTTIETLKQQASNGEVTLSIADLFKLIWNQKITIKKG